MPKQFGENRNKISYISCLKPAAADAYMAGVETSDSTFVSTEANAALETREGITIARIAPASLQSGPYQGWVRVTDQQGLGGNSLDINVSLGDDNCAAVLQPVYWHIESVYQWKGSLCTYWQWVCGQKLVHDNMPIFTIDARGGDQYLSSLPDYLGDSRHRIAWVRCIYGEAADAYFEDLDSSNMTVIGGENATVDTAALSVGKVEVAPPKAVASTSVNARAFAPVSDLVHPEGPLEICHDVNMGGVCYNYKASDGCKGNPFNFDAIKAFELERGWHCVFYPYLDCKLDRGEPVHVEARDGPIRVNDVTHEIWSMTCGRKGSWLALEEDEEEAEDSIAPTRETRAIVTSETSLANPLKVCHDVNMGGQCFLYETPGCMNNPFNVDAIETFQLLQGWLCLMWPYTDCQQNRGPPHYVNSSSGPIQVNDVDYEIWSVTCSPVRLDENVVRDVGPGDTTICDASYFEACTDNVNAMDGCSSFDSAAGGPNSLKQYQGAGCKWYRGYGCSGESGDTEPMTIDTRDGAYEIDDLGMDNNLFKSVACRVEEW